MVEAQVARPEGAPPPVRPVAGAEGQARAALEASLPRARACYEEALARSAWVYGEVVVRITVRADGTVEDAASVLDTVGDPALVSCVERTAQAASLPAPGAGGLVLRYPFLFTSDVTPPEVVRALRQQYGLLPEDDAPAIEAPQRAPAPGTVETW